MCELVRAKQLTDTVNYPDVNKVMELHIQMDVSILELVYRLVSVPVIN